MILTIIWIICWVEVPFDRPAKPESFLRQWVNSTALEWFDDVSVSKEAVLNFNEIFHCIQHRVLLLHKCGVDHAEQQLCVERLDRFGALPLNPTNDQVICFLNCITDVSGKSAVEEEKERVSFVPQQAVLLNRFLDELNNDFFNIRLEWQKSMLLPLSENDFNWWAQI